MTHTALRPLIFPGDTLFTSSSPDTTQSGLLSGLPELSEAREGDIVGLCFSVHAEDFEAVADRPSLLIKGPQGGMSLLVANPVHYIRDEKHQSALFFLVDQHLQVSNSIIDRRGADEWETEKDHGNREIRDLLVFRHGSALVPRHYDIRPRTPADMRNKIIFFSEIRNTAHGKVRQLPEMNAIISHTSRWYVGRKTVLDRPWIAGLEDGHIPMEPLSSLVEFP